jgi:hypothetical protein
MRSRPPRRSPDTTPYHLSAVLRDNVKVFVASREVKGAELTPHLPAPGWALSPHGGCLRTPAWVSAGAVDEGGGGGVAGP